MRIRLRMLLTSFNKSAMEYALARLEVALANPAAPAPPVVSRLGASVRSDDDLTAKWPSAVAQVGAAAEYVAAGIRGDFDFDRDAAWTRLTRAVKMMTQFAESIEWLAVQPRANAAGEDAL